MSPKKKRPPITQVIVAMVCTVPLTEKEAEDLVVENGNRDAVVAREARQNDLKYLTGYYGRLQAVGRKEYLILPADGALAELMVEAFHAAFAAEN